MEKIHLLLLFAVWVLFSMAEGKRDASYYHANMISPNPVKENLHWLFFMTRGIVLGLITWICLFYFAIFVVSVYVFSLMLVFSFLHNGVYFATRHQLDNNIYPKGFWDDSTSSTATINMNVKMRTIMAVIGVIGVIMAILM